MTFIKMIEAAKTEYINTTHKKIWYPGGTQEFYKWCEHMYGINISIYLLQTEYVVTDAKKYSIFLLKFSNAPGNP